MKRILAIYRDQARASRAARELEASGFASDAISVLAADSASGQAFMATERSAAAKTALTGAAIGSTGGLIAASLAGVGAILTGPIGLVLAGSVAGGLLGALVGLGIPDNEAQARGEEIQDGAILVALDLEDDDLQREGLALAALGHTDYRQIVEIDEPEIRDEPDESEERDESSE